MAHDYQFEELGPRAFEQLVVAIALARFGAGVEAYGSGADGGREATFDGRIDWSEDEQDPGGHWSGYTVIQAKQREHVADPADNLAWLRGEIRSELDRWMSKPRKRFPRNLLFVTNVRLSAVEEVGGVDVIRAWVDRRLDHNFGTDERPDTLRKRGLGAVRIWHRDYLNALISSHSDIRNAFPALLTTGDILTRLEALQRVPTPNETAELLRDHASSTMRHDRWVRLSEAGGSERRSVEQIIIDLPYRSAHPDNRQDVRRGHVIDSFLREAQLIRRASIWTEGRPRHLVITGAPGNGKSTLVKFLTQSYRSRFSRHENSTTAGKELIASTEQALKRLGTEAVALHRWPLTINLATMAGAMGAEGGPSLLRWITHLLSERTDREVDIALIQRWLKAWPTVLFFDGFDEVTAPELRVRVLDEISELVERFDEWDADALIVLTTRPTGFSEQVLPHHFQQWDLDYFTDSEALAYGRHITRVHHQDDEELIERLLGRFDNAVATRSADRLLKTPLQVLIVTLILEGTGSLPVNRYRLFWEYFRTIFKREAEKNTTLQAFYGEFEDHIVELHERIGLVLQIDCERSGDPVARLPLQRLRQMAHDRLSEVGYDSNSEAARIADRLCDIATKRLVLLSPSDDDTVAFEVRSLQELMAARSLTSVEPETIRYRLGVTARSPHWRNTWLFAAGRLFAEGGDHQRNLVLEVVERVDQQPGTIGWLYPSAPELAAHLLEDGLTANKPLWERRLLECALRAFDGPMMEDPRAIAIGLAVAARDMRNLVRIRNSMKQAFSHSPRSAAIAADISLYYDARLRPPPGTPETANASSNAQETSLVSVGEILPALEPELLAPLSGPQRALLDRVMAGINTLAFGRGHLDLVVENVRNPSWELRTLELLPDPQLADVLELWLDGIEPQDWSLRSMLALYLNSAASRTPVGHLLGPGPSQRPAQG